MFYLRRTPLLLILIFCISLSAALAQDCPAIVQRALQAADSACATTERNQACYGNVQLEALVQPEVASLQFAQPGDKLDLTSINALHLSPLDALNNQWGVALLKLQANFPDTLPGQNVTMLLFGDVQLTAAEVLDSSAQSLPATATTAANVRQQPARDALIVAGLNQGDSVAVDGRLADNSWLHLTQSANSGWVFAELLAVNGDVNTLPVLDAEQVAMPLGPMQAFYFRSGIGNVDCLEAPNGLLLQSPPGGPVATLNINGAWVSFGSTVFVQAPSGGDQMTISTLAGMAQVQAQGQAKVVVQGAQTSLQLDAAGAVSSVPSQPVPVVESLLKPLVSKVNATQLITPTYEDAAANATIQTLTDDDLIIPLVEDQPVKPASPETIELTEDDIFIPLPPGPKTAPEPCSTCITLPNGEVVGPAVPATEELYEYPTAIPPTSAPPKATNVPDKRVNLIDGLWTRQYGETATSGDCSDYDGDNGGPDREYNPEDPNQQAQLCYWNAGGVVLLDNDTFRWSKDSSNTYVSETRVDSYDDSSSHKVLSVIDASHVDVTYIHQAGTCTVTTVVHYTLYISGRPFGCSAAMPLVESVNAEGTPIVDPAPTALPEEVIIDPVIAGQYTMTWLPFDRYCAAEYAPAFSEVTVTPTSFDDVSLTINGETLYLSGDGMRGEFSRYGSDKRQVNLTRRFADDFNVGWQAVSPDNTQSCYAQGVLKLATPAANQPHFSPPGAAPTTNLPGAPGAAGTPAAPAEAAPPISGDYAVTWSPIPGIECPAALQPKLPDFTQTTISASATSFTLTGGSTSYQIDLVPYGTQWMYMQFESDNSGVVINFDKTQPGQFTGTYTYFAPDGNVCMAQLQLTGQ